MRQSLKLDCSVLFMETSLTRTDRLQRCTSSSLDSYLSISSTSFQSFLRILLPLSQVYPSVQQQAGLPAFNTFYELSQAHSLNLDKSTSTQHTITIFLIAVKALLAIKEDTKKKKSQRWLRKNRYQAACITPKLADSVICQHKLSLSSSAHLQF